MKSEFCTKCIESIQNFEQKIITYETFEKLFMEFEMEDKELLDLWNLLVKYNVIIQSNDFCSNENIDQIFEGKEKS